MAADSLDCTAAPLKKGIWYAKQTTLPPVKAVKMDCFYQ